MTARVRFFTGDVSSDGSPVTSTVATADVVDPNDPGQGVLADDDRPLSVSSETVNEGSLSVVQSVTGVQDQYVRLELAVTGTGEGHATPDVDYQNALEFWDGTQWVAYVPGTFVKITDASGVLLVRAPILADDEAEASETFRLTATNTGGSSASGVVTIRDDGQGDYWIGNARGPATLQDLDDNDSCSTTMWRT